MTALDDLKSQVTQLGASVNAEILAAETALTAALARGGTSVAAADVEAVVAQLATLRGTVDTATATFAAPAVPPAGPTGPAPV